MTLLFVYGTFLRGEANHGRLAGARFVGEGVTTAAFELVDLGDFPGLVAGGEARVQGEVYAVEPGMIATLDEFEDHPDTYRRTLLELEDGTAVETYLLPRRLASTFPRIASGNWRQRAAG